jgi:hypothetical protein
LKGHTRLRERIERGYRKGRYREDLRAVAVVVRRYTRYCGRCGETLKQETVDGHRLDGLTLDERDMETFDREGVVWLTRE